MQYCVLVAAIPARCVHYLGPLFGPIIRVWYLGQCLAGLTLRLASMYLRV